MKGKDNRTCLNMIILYSALQNQNQLKNSTLILDMLKLFTNLHQCEKGKFFEVEEEEELF